MESIKLSNRHPDKDIQEAIEVALAAGWKLVKRKGKGHAWCILLCPLSDRTGCRISVWTTPRNANNHANQITRKVAKCDCGNAENEQDL